MQQPNSNDPKYQEFLRWQASQQKKPARWRRWLKIAGLVAVGLILIAFAYNYAHTGNPFLSVQMVSARATGTAITIATNIAVAQAADTRLALQSTPLPVTTSAPIVLDTPLAHNGIPHTPIADSVTSSDAPPTQIPDAPTQSAAEVYNDAYYFAALGSQVAGTGSTPADSAIAMMGTRILQIEAKCAGLQSSQIKDWGGKALERMAAKGQDPNPFDMLTYVLRNIINDPARNCQADFENYP